VTRIGKARVATFAVLGAVMCLGPVYGHFFAKGRLEHLGWRMYRVRALDFYAVDYRRHHPDGHEEPLDRYEVLGFGDGSDAPFDLWRIGSRDSAYAYGRAMCERLGPGADVRVRLRRATVDGWADEDDGGHDLCNPAEAP